MQSIPRILVPLVATPLLVAVVACGGSTSSSGGNSLSGSVNGVTFTVQSAVANVMAGTSCNQDPDGGETCTGNGNSLVIDLLNRPYTCDDIGQSDLASTDELLLTVANLDGTVGTGTFPLVAADSGAAEGGGSLLLTSDANCMLATFEAATSGTVTLTENTASHLTGSFDVTFPGGHFTGSFDVDVCSKSLLAGNPQGVTPACH
jgi:hypothetical protein